MYKSEWMLIIFGAFLGSLLTFLYTGGFVNKAESPKRLEFKVNHCYRAIHAEKFNDIKIIEIGTYSALAKDLKDKKHTVIIYDKNKTAEDYKEIDCDLYMKWDTKYYDHH